MLNVVKPSSGLNLLLDAKLQMKLILTIYLKKLKKLADY